MAVKVSRTRFVIIGVERGKSFVAIPTAQAQQPTPAKVGNTHAKVTCELANFVQTTGKELGLNLNDDPSVQLRIGLKCPFSFVNAA